MAAAEEDVEERATNIYRAARSIKRRDNSLYNALRSIYEDSIFVAEIAGLWPELPLVANLRCGLWYSSRFDATCYFKSTDGHANNWSFSTSRLNLHLALLAGQRGGCIIVDSTRKGKRFPDSMSKTIPIWACVLNRAIEQRLRMPIQRQGDGELDSNISLSEIVEKPFFPNRDCSLHLPLWISNIERAAIEDRVEKWMRQLEACGADIDSVASKLTKPLRPLWISQRSVIWLNEVPKYDSWNFTPIILVSASASQGTIQQRSTSEFSWNYIPGAGDDEESWARGLDPNLFWKHAYDLIDSGPSMCNQKVSELVEKERVYRAQRGDCSHQVTVKPQKKPTSNDSMSGEQSCMFVTSYFSTSATLSNKKCALYWIGSSNLAVGAAIDGVSNFPSADCILNCGPKSSCVLLDDEYLHLPIMSSKQDRFSLFNSLHSAISFADLNLKSGKKLFICCQNGEDISICVCLAILAALFDEENAFDSGKFYMSTSITKWEMRRRLVFICKFAVNARPSRGNLKQVFGFLRRERSPVVDDHEQSEEMGAVGVPSSRKQATVEL